ncbi:MAG: hypothetical protein AAGK00_16460 [Pseudomonadota bacterium]
MRRLVCVIFSFVSVLCMGIAQADHPLIDLARKIPANANGTIVLNDVAASRRQLSAVYATDADMPDARLMAFTPLHLPDGFDEMFLPYAADLELERRLGFSPLEIDQIGGWGRAPNVAVIIRGDVIAKSATTIPSALQAWGHRQRVFQDGLVYWRLSDDELDRDMRNLGPFTGGEGYPTRFLVGGEWLLTARTWPALSLTADSGRGLTGDSAARALLEAAVTADVQGELLSVQMKGPQIPRNDAIPMLLGVGATAEHVRALRLILQEIDVPTLPYFTRHAVLLWQDGTAFTAALAMTYPDRASAAEALQALDEGLRTMPVLVGFGERHVGDVLPRDRSTQIVETQTGTVAMMMFSASLAGTDPRHLTRFLKNPAHALRALMVTRKLDLLLSGS